MKIKMLKKKTHTHPALCVCVCVTLRLTCGRCPVFMQYDVIPIDGAIATRSLPVAIFAALIQQVRLKLPDSIQASLNNNILLSNAANVIKP